MVRTRAGNTNLYLCLPGNVKVNEIVVKTAAAFVLLVFSHFLSDWLGQSNWEAMQKHKIRWIRAVHCGVYSVGMIPTMHWAIGLDWKIVGAAVIWLFVSHFIEDSYILPYLWLKHIRRWPGIYDGEDFEYIVNTKPLALILVIVCDQLIHISCLMPIAWVAARG